MNPFQVIGSIFSGIQDQSNNAQNYSQQQMDRQYQMQIDRENFNRQDRAYNTQQEWNKSIWNRDEQRYQETLRREDTAVSRRVADLKSAGLSPVLASGQGAMSGMQSPPQIRTGTAPQQDKPHTVPQMKLGIMSDLMRMQSDISLTNAQRELINAQKDRFDWDTAWYIGKNLPTNADTASKFGTNIPTVVDNLGKSIMSKIKALKMTDEEKAEYEKRVRENPQAKSIGELYKTGSKQSGASGKW